VEVPLIGAAEAGTTIGADGVTEKVDPARITAQLQEIRDALAPVMSAPDSGMPLKSVEIELGVTASGEVGFIVSKAALEVSATITFTFERPEA